MGQRLFKLYRIAGTGFSFAVFGLGAAALGLLLLLTVTPLPLGAQRKQTLVRRWVHRAARAYVTMMRAMGLLSYRIEGLTQLPDSGALIVANHPSLLDAVFLLSAIPDLNCIAKAALCRNPFTRGIFSLANYIPNSDDGEALIERAAQSVRRGQCLMVFPEGTRRRSDWPLAFRRGAANIAVRAQCPVVPVLIRVSPPTLQKGEAWYQVPEQPPHFSLSIQAPLRLEEHIDTLLPITRQARRLTELLENHFQRQLTGDDNTDPARQPQLL